MKHISLAQARSKAAVARRQLAGALAIASGLKEQARIAKARLKEARKKLKRLRKQAATADDEARRADKRAKKADRTLQRLIEKSKKGGRKKRPANPQDQARRQNQPESERRAFGPGGARRLIRASAVRPVWAPPRPRPMPPR